MTDQAEPGAMRPVWDRPIIMSAPMVRALIEGRKTQHRVVLPSVPPSPGMDVLRPEETPRHSAPYLDAYCSLPSTAANPRGMSDLWCWWTRDDRMGSEFRVGFKPGDRLWVAEAWQVARETLDWETGGEYDVFEWGEDYGDPREYLKGDARFGVCAGLFYAADGEDVNPSVFYPLTGLRDEVLRKAEIDWRSASDMPRWASRLTLIVESVRVERLKDISRGDAMAEGIVPLGFQAGFEMPGAEGGARYDTARDAYAALWDSIHGEGAWQANPYVAALTFRTIPQNIDSLTPPTPTPNAAVSHDPGAGGRRG